MSDTLRPKHIASLKYKQMVESLKEIVEDETKVQQFLTRFYEIMTQSSYTDIHKEYYKDNKEKLNKARAEQYKKTRAEKATENAT